MKIKDVEKRTGITSYNIRFYEKENLLIPKRNPVNGYREYTEEDILLLNRIKMLRMLDIPVSDIRKILYEKETLTSVLNTHLLKIKEEENRLRQNYFLCEELIKMDMSVTDLSEEMLDKMVSGKEEYIYQLERIKRQDRIQKIFDTSKLIVCIVGGVIAVIMCVQLYLKLCNTYMSAPFKVITLILSLILVVSILRIIVCNETKYEDIFEKKRTNRKCSLFFLTLNFL